MARILIAKIALENVACHFDKAYDYCVPENLRARAQPGCRVSVPFGRGNRMRFGMLFSLSEEEPAGKLKQLSEVLDEEPLLDAEMLCLAVWLKAHTFCTLYEAVRTILPSGINLRHKMRYVLAPGAEAAEWAALPPDERAVLELLQKRQTYVGEERIVHLTGLHRHSDVFNRLLKKGLAVRNDEAMQRTGDATVRMVRLCAEREEVEKLLPSLTKKQRAVVEVLLDAGCASVKELCYFTGVTPVVVTALEKKGAVAYYESEIYRNPVRGGGQAQASPSELVLTQKQQSAFEELLKQYHLGRGGVSLLFGVTGSGKTQVFLRMIDEVSAQGKGVIVMVPEISLTPQTLAIFQKRYGNSVAVFHSALSLGERMDEWKRVKNGEAGIVVGTRCAVFAPFADLGLIIMDEEQEHTYKSESSPRYHARDVAKFRCAQQNALLLLASATPSVESYAAAQSGRYSLHVLNERYGDAVLPEVITVDLCEENAAGNRTAISRRLCAELEQNLAVGQQSILLMNRRGYHTFAACRSCGHVVSCPNCSISLTYHRANGRLMCHYCGYSEPLRDTCPDCGEKDVRYAGFGTQRVEDELLLLLPQARILRMDADTTMSRYAHEDKLAAFARGEFDIMLGTQMVAKGLDFPNVTLVGVISADQQLYNDDYRSLERTFALLTQVVGRSGRGAIKGRAVIQTLTPENPVIRQAARQDYEAFYQTEIMLRKAMVYPPFCDILCIGFVGEQEAQVAAASKCFLEQLKALSRSDYPEQKFIVLGPMPPRIAKLSNKFRYRLIVKCRNVKGFRAMIAQLLTQFPKDARFKGVTAYADMNPESIF